MPGVVVAGLVAAEIIIAGSIAAFAINVVVTLALVAISYALRPDAPDLGIAGAGDRAKDRLRNIKQPLSPHRVVYGKTRIGGTITYLHTTNSDEELHEVITIASHPIQEVTKIYGNKFLLQINSSGSVTNNSGNDDDPANDWAGNMFVYTGLGTTSSDATLLSRMVANTDGNWTTGHKQEGMSKLYVRFVYDRDAFGSGTPNLTCLVKGKPLYDPRNSSTAYSNNAALCILDYIRDAGYGLGEPDDNIDMASFITAANTSDESVILKGGGTEKRYVCNGTFETDQKPERILKDLLSACSGTLTYQGGKWALRVGTFVTPTIEINEDDVQGQIDVTSQVGRRNLFNQVQSVYTEPNELYQPTDAPLVKNALYLSEDQGEIITRDIEFPFTTAVSTSQRLSKIELEKIRQQISVTMTLSLKKGLQVQAGDTIGVTNSRMGWSNKPFVIQEWGIQFDSDKEALVIGVSLRETASDVFDWNTGNETTVDAAPNTNLPNPFNVRPPTGLSVSEELYFSSGGLSGSGAKVRAIVSWASAGKFVHQYEVQYKKDGEADYTFATLAQDSPAPINDLSAGLYSFRVRGLSSIGSRSSFTTVTKTLAGLTVVPNDLTGFSVRALDGFAYLTWTEVDDLDVIHGGYIRIRHTPVVVGATWNAGVDIGKKLSGNVTDVVLPLIPGTYLAKAVDSSGFFSTNAVSSITTVKNINIFNLVTSIDEASAGFVGAKSDMIVSGSNLRLDGTPFFIFQEDGYKLLTEEGDELEREIANTSLVESYGMYNFSNFVDLGQIFTSRVYAEFETSSFEVSDLIDTRVTNIDTWNNFDGEPSDKVTAELQMRYTDDNPSLSPAWSPWQKLLIGDFKARAYDFRVIVESLDSVYNIDISKLKAIVDMPDRVERGSDLSSGVTTYSVTYIQEYFAPPTVGITANAIGSNNHFVISNSTRTGFDINFYQGNGIGNPITANFNYQAIGY